MRALLLLLALLFVSHAELFETDYFGERKLERRIKILHKNPKLYSIGQHCVHAKDGRLQVMLYWTEEIK